MEHERKESLLYQSRRKHMLMHFRNGLQFLKEDRVLLIIYIMLIFFYIAFGISLYVNYKYSAADFTTKLLYLTWFTVMLVSFPVLSLGTLCIIGKPIKAWKIDPLMQRICVKNGIGETPILLYYLDNTEKDNSQYFEFSAYGIPLSFYEDHRAEIESALNVNIVKIMQGSTRYSVVLVGAEYNSEFNKPIMWNDKYISEEEFELTIGSNLIGKEQVNLNSLPHILIGGSTGSGKSVLLKTLLYQCAVKNAEVMIADFKGGIDYNGKWHSVGKIITNTDSFIAELDIVISALNIRKDLLYENNCVNIAEYNRSMQLKLNHIIIGCDEIAEILDKTGLDRTEKEKVSAIESRLATIARQGRAFGIHLILATQRPDATILSGQIRNNIDYRICGRADDVLSKIVLDNTDASEKIPKWERGLFLTNSNTLVRAYYFDESYINTDLIKVGTI